jgi:hypothetical protein
VQQVAGQKAEEQKAEARQAAEQKAVRARQAANEEAARAQEAAEEAAARARQAAEEEAARAWQAVEEERAEARGSGRPGWCALPTGLQARGVRPRTEMKTGPTTSFTSVPASVHAGRRRAGAGKGDRMFLYIVSVCAPLVLTHASNISLIQYLHRHCVMMLILF